MYKWHKIYIHLFLQGHPVDLIHADVDLELGLQLRQDAGALLLHQEAGHARLAHRDGLGADLVHHATQDLLSNLTRSCVTIDLCKAGGREDMENAL